MDIGASISYLRLVFVFGMLLVVDRNPDVFVIGYVLFGIVVPGVLGVLPVSLYCRAVDYIIGHIESVVLMILCALHDP